MCLKKWLGILSRAYTIPVPEEGKDESNEFANQTWRAHAALDRVYGMGWAKDNPEIVARFMQAQATQQLATEATALREILGSGSGAITIGIERV